MIAGLPKNIFLRYITRLVMVITLSTFFVSLGWARTIYVDINGEADFAKIQEAIEVADYGDTVQVVAGIYNENIRMKDEVDLIGEGAGVTFIKGSNNEVVRGAQHCTISGFTIANPLNSGGYSDFSHGINCYYVPDHGSSMVIKNNIIKDHYVGIGYTNALIINNVIINNRHSGIGLGNPVIKNNILMENGYGSHGAIYMNNTINGANGFNTSGWHISYNDVWNNNPDYSHDACAGIGDISEDPLFVDKANGDYHLQTESLCIDTGDPSILDEDGSRSDIGAFPFTGERISPDQSPPTVSISISPETVTVGGSIEVTVTGTDDKDLSAIWWWGVSTGDTDLDKAHWYPCSGTSVTNIWKVSIANLAPGTYKLGANARDAAYPTSGEAHQASEGEGIAYASFTVLVPIPSPPTNISVVDTGIGKQLKLTYDINAIKYFSHVRIYRSNTVGDALNNLVYDNIKSTYIVDAGLTNGITYYYVIRSINIYGKESPNTDEYGGTPHDITPPVPPSNITVLNTGVGGELLLSWTNPVDDDFSHVRIYRSVIEGVLGNLIYDDITTTTKVDTGLSNSVTYYYTLRAVDFVGNESKPFYGKPSTVPFECTDVTNMATSLPPEQIHLNGITASWREEYHYQYGGGMSYGRILNDGSYVDDNEPGSGVLIISCSGPMPEQIITLTTDAGTIDVFLPETGTYGAQHGFFVANDGSTYWGDTDHNGYGSDRMYPLVAMVSEHLARKSGNALDQYKGIPRDTTPPEPPPDLQTVATGTGDSIEISWTASTSEDVTCYRIYRSIDLSTYQLINLSISISYTDTSITEGKTYYYAVTCLDEAGNESTKTDPIEITPNIAPAKVEGLTVLTVPEGRALKLSWKGNTESDLSGYRIYRSTQAEACDYLTTVNSCEYSDINLTNGIAYYYQISAIDEVPNEGEKSEQVSGIPEKKDMAPPTVSISISPETVTVGGSIEVTVTGTDDKDLLAIWWWGVNTPDTELNKAHWHSCSGTSAVHTWTISTSNLPPGTYTLGANARDKAYPTPGEAHQASEGDGIAYANFVVLERKPDLRIIDFSWTPESPVAGKDFDFDLLIYFKCEGERDIFLDVNQNGTYDSGEDVWNDAYQVQDSFNVTLKINGKPFKDVILTYNPILAGTGWRIKFGESGGSERFTNEFYRACVKGENEIYVKVDSKDEIAETNENNNELTKKIYVYDIISPELVIINPKDNDKIKDIITVLAEATDNVAVAKVEFYVDSSQVHIDTNPPYEWEWQTYSVENGEHIIKVVAYDTFGNATASSVKVQVENEIARAWIEVPKEGKRIKGNAVTVIAGATRSTAKVLFQYRKKWTQSEPEIVNEMTMSCDGKVKVTLIKASADLVSDIFLASPEKKLLIEDNLTNVGTIIEEEYKAGTKVNFFIRTYGDSRGLGTYDHYATGEGSSYNGTPYCLVERLSLTTWKLSFEDLPGDSADWDYDDVVLLVEVVPSNEYEDGLDSPWVDITLDSKRPYACYWNVSGVDNGGYSLRAIAYDKYGCPDPNPSSITVIVDDVNWDIHEDGNPEVDPNKPHRKCEKFSKERGATITIADGTQAIIPPGIDISAEIIEIAILNPKDLSNILPPEESSLRSIGVFREYKFSDGSKIFNKEITLILPYPDENGDGIVDGTEVQAKSLKPYWLDEEKEIWIPIEDSSVHSAYFSKIQQEIGNFVKVIVNHFTVFSLMGTSPKMDLKNVIVYPNPYKPNSGLGHTHIYFDGLTEEAIVTIYTITGRLVNEITEHKISGKTEWNVLNSDDEKVASGVYLYIVTDGKNKPSKGKFAIIR